MNLKEYQELADRTKNPRVHGFDRAKLSLIGLMAEVGEFATEIQHSIEHESKLDQEHVEEELGDILWRLSDICSSLELDLDRIGEKNIAKLRKRHPNGFSAQTSILRLDEVS